MISNALTHNSSSFDLASPSVGSSIFPESPMTPQRHHQHRHHHARHPGAPVPAHGIHHPAAALAAATANGGRIDQTKAKTKMCRNFLLGIACPFEDRCAFAHGTTEIRANLAKAAAAAASGLSESPDSASCDSALHSPRADGSGAVAAAVAAAATVMDGPYVSPAAAVAAVTAGPLAPPSYEAFVYSANGMPLDGPHLHHALLDSPYESRSTTPPSYPSRYRFNPYSEFGIVFEA